jgi:hypothetical protein
MPSAAIKAALGEANEAAISVFEEKEYLTKFGSTGDEDPWDEDSTPKDAWVHKLIERLEELPRPEVGNCDVFIRR